MTRVPPESTQAPADDLIGYGRLADRLGALAQHPRVKVVSLGRTAAGRFGAPRRDSRPGRALRERRAESQRVSIIRAFLRMRGGSVPTP